MRRKGVRIIEFATVAAVLGIFVSLAVPSLLQVQARSRVDALLKSARSCRAELPAWISNELSNPQVEADQRAEEKGREHRIREVLEKYVRVYNERLNKNAVRGGGDESLLVVEPTGALPIYCRRDGRIHLIPFVDSALETAGAIVVVTHEDGRAGPAYDGILAVYNVKTGTE